MENKDLENIIIEFNKFIEFIPSTSLYIPNYIKQKITQIKPHYQKLIDFIELKSSIKCFYLNKYEFIEHNEKTFFNKEKLSTKIKEIFSNTKYNNKKIEKITNYCYEKFIAEDTPLAMTKAHPTLPLIIILDYNKSFLPEITIFHELCHCLQMIYNKEINTKCELLEDKLTILKNNEERNKLEKEIFLNKYFLETQANLFAYLISLLCNYEKLNTDKLENIILFNSSLSLGYDGYFEYPILEKEIYNIKTKPEFYNIFFQDNNKSLLNYENLYNYTKEKVLKMQNIYKKALFNDKKEIKDIIKFYYPKKPNNLLLSFDLVISGLRKNIYKKEIKLNYYKNKLELFKQNFPQNTYEKLNQSFNTLINKLQENQIKIVE